MRTRMEEIAGGEKEYEKKRELGEKRRDRNRDTVMYETEFLEKVSMRMRELYVQTWSMNTKGRVQQTEEKI